MKSNTWHRKPLGDAISAPVFLPEIEQAFTSHFEKAGHPDGMAVFTRQIPGGMHCEVFAYFSPAAQDIALALQAEACEAPTEGEVQLLAGISPFIQT